MKQDRLQRAQSISRKIISEYFSEHLDAEILQRHGIITVTQVIISSELSYIDIYVSSLKNEELLTKSLKDYAPEIQRVLWKKIDFIKVPKVRFRYDDSGKSSSQIYTTIKNISKDHNET